MVVGEAPGRTEDEGGEPFTGRSGQLLTRVIFDEVGLTREEYFITNVVKCRPPHNRPPTTLEQSTCRPWLEAQLVTQRPTVLLCVGNTASRAVLGWRAGVTEVHGQVVEVHGARGLATYHPAAVLRGGPNVEAVFRADLATVKELLA
jgi:DNA polymerase